MKNLILSYAVTCAAIFTCINTSYAQNTKPRIGITAGADLMTLGKIFYVGRPFDVKSRVGFQGGIYADLPLSNLISMQPSVLYTQKGGTVEANVPDYLSISGGSGSSASSEYSNFTGSVRMNYIDVPVLINFKTADGFSFVGGPQLSFLLAQHSSFLEYSTAGSVYSGSDSTNGFKKIVVGGNVGIGYSFMEHAGINLYYQFDFERIADNSTGANPPKNSGVSLSVSYLF